MLRRHASHSNQTATTASAAAASREKGEKGGPSSPSLARIAASRQSRRRRRAFGGGASGHTRAVFVLVAQLVAQHVVAQRVRIIVHLLQQQQQQQQQQDKHEQVENASPLGVRQTRRQIGRAAKRRQTTTAFVTCRHATWRWRWRQPKEDKVEEHAKQQNTCSIVEQRGGVGAVAGRPQPLGLVALLVALLVRDRGEQGQEDRAAPDVNDNRNSAHVKERLGRRREDELECGQAPAEALYHHCN